MFKGSSDQFIAEQDRIVRAYREARDAALSEDAAVTAREAALVDLRKLGYSTGEALSILGRSSRVPLKG